MHTHWEILPFSRVEGENRVEKGLRIRPLVFFFFFSSADFFLLGDARGANSAHATLRVHWNFEESQAILHRSHLVESCTVRHQMTSSQHQAQIPKPVLVSKTFDRPASLSQYQFWDINLRTAILFSTNHSSEREPGLLQLLPE